MESPCRCRNALALSADGKTLVTGGDGNRAPCLGRGHGNPTPFAAPPSRRQRGHGHEA